MSLFRVSPRFASRVLQLTDWIQGEWLSCLHCYRFFTKRPAELICPDCVRGVEKRE